MSENKNLFPHRLRMRSVGLPKGEVQFCLVQKEKGVCPSRVMEKPVQVKTKKKKDSRCMECSGVETKVQNRSAASLK